MIVAKRSLNAVKVIGGISFVPSFIATALTAPAIAEERKSARSPDHINLWYVTLSSFSIIRIDFIRQNLQTILYEQAPCTCGDSCRIIIGSCCRNVCSTSCIQSSTFYSRICSKSYKTSLYPCCCFIWPGSCLFCLCLDGKR